MGRKRPPHTDTLRDEHAVDVRGDGGVEANNNDKRREAKKKGGETMDSLRGGRRMREREHRLASHQRNGERKGVH